MGQKSYSKDKDLLIDVDLIPVKNANTSTKILTWLYVISFISFILSIIIICNCLFFNYN